MIGTLCGGGRALTIGKCSGCVGASGSPAAGSGECRRIVRDIIPSGCWVCNSNSEQRHLLLKIGISQRGMQNNCSGSGRCSGLASGHTGVFTRIFPGSISSRPAESRTRRTNPNNCSFTGPGTARRFPPGVPPG